ncbi:septum formation initiator family protein [Mechercharimyces sp. CAU 1602]|nr:septum formation initiator family protein [Mechercharimyces sp. CAU 1602]
MKRSQHPDEPHIVSFETRRSSEEPAAKKPQAKKRVLAPGVKRRRRLWLAIMVVFILWSGGEIIYQSFKVQAKEQEYAKVEEEFAQLKAERKKLEKEVERLQTDEYMMYLARKFGYKLPGEETYAEPER